MMMMCMAKTYLPSCRTRSVGIVEGHFSRQDLDVASQKFSFCHCHLRLRCETQREVILYQRGIKVIPGDNRAVDPSVPISSAFNHHPLCLL